MTNEEKLKYHRSVWFLAQCVDDHRDRDNLSGCGFGYAPKNRGDGQSPFQITPTETLCFYRGYDLKVLRAIAAEPGAFLDAMALNELYRLMIGIAPFPG
jgi:hypothetical protein